MFFLMVYVSEEEMELEYLWEEELENDLETATGSNLSGEKGTMGAEGSMGPVWGGMVMLSIGVIVGVLLVTNWRFSA